MTGLYRYTKARGLSLYYGLIYLSTLAINRVEAFRYALKGGSIILLDERVTSFTDLKKGSDLFHIVTMPSGESLDEFCISAKANSAAQAEFLCMETQGNHLIYFSSLPWVELTSLTNERNFDPDDAVPRLAWGKYRDENGRKLLGYSMEVNHRFVDGIHIGAFVTELEKLISEL